MKQRIFAWFLAVMMLLIGCSPNATVTPSTSPTAAPTETSIPTVVPSPTETLVPTATPSPTITPTPVPTATPDPRPTFPDSGTIRSEHLTAALSQQWMDIANVAEIGVDPAVLENARRVMLVHLAWRLSHYSKDPRLNLFKNAEDPEPKDLSSSERLKRALTAYEQNAQLGGRGFQYEFDFGEGVKGKVVNVDIRALATQEEWDTVSRMLEKTTYVTRVAKAYGADMKSLIYFDEQGVFHVYSWGGNPYKPLPRLATYNITMQFLIDMFNGPLWELEYIVGDTIARRRNGVSSSSALFEALGCGTEECYRDGKTSGYMDITLKDGTQLTPNNK